MFIFAYIFSKNKNKPRGMIYPYNNPSRLNNYATTTIATYVRMYYSSTHYNYNSTIDSILYSSS